MFGNLFRARKSVRTSFDYILKEGQREMFEGGGPGLFTAADRRDAAAADMDIHERQRLAALKAWETRRRNAKEGKAPQAKKPVEAKPEFALQAQGAFTLERRQMEQILPRVAKALSERTKDGIKNMGERAGGGINKPVIIDVEGKKYFVKFPGESHGAKAEVKAAEVSELLGWRDMNIPHQLFKSADGRTGLVRGLYPEGKTLWSWEGTDGYGKALRAGGLTEDWRHDSNNPKIAKVAMYDYVMGIMDRHKQNYWLSNKGELFSIDASRAFVDNDELPNMQGDHTPPYSQDIWKKMPNELVRHVLAYETDLVKATKGFKGYNSDRDASVGMQKRIDRLRRAYTRNPDAPFISLLGA